MKDKTNKNKECCCVSYERGVYPCLCNCHTKTPQEKDTSWEETLKELLSEVRQGVKDDVCIYELLRLEIQKAKEDTIKEVIEEIEKYNRFQCGACESNVSSLSHTQFCQFREDLKTLLKQKIN